MQASDFSAGDRRRPFYTTQDPNCARLWAIQYHTWMNAFGVPQKLAVVKFTFDPTTFKFHDFGKVVTPEWQEVRDFFPLVTQTRSNCPDSYLSIANPVRMEELSVWKRVGPTLPELRRDRRADESRAWSQDRQGYVFLCLVIQNMFNYYIQT